MKKVDATINDDGIFEVKGVDETIAGHKGQSDINSESVRRLIYTLKSHLEESLTDYLFRDFYKLRTIRNRNVDEKREPLKLTKKQQKRTKTKAQGKARAISRREMITLREKVNDFQADFDVFCDREDDASLYSATGDETDFACVKVEEALIKSWVIRTIKEHFNDDPVGLKVTINVTAACAFVHVSFSVDEASVVYSRPYGVSPISKSVMRRLLKLPRKNKALVRDSSMLKNIVVSMSVLGCALAYQENPAASLCFIPLIADTLRLTMQGVGEMFKVWRYK